MPVRILSRSSGVGRNVAAAGPGLPTGGTTGQVLAKVSDISYAVQWTDLPLTLSWGDITGKPDLFPPEEHNHDDSYYTKTEVDELIPIKFPISSLTCWYFNSTKDLDERTLTDLDGAAIYEPGDVFDNPPVPTRYFDTLADLLAVEGSTWDRAVIRNGLAGDGNRSEWRMAGDPTLADNGFNLRLTDDEYGFAERVAILA